MPNIGHRAIGILINSLFIIIKFYIIFALYILYIYVLYTNTILLYLLFKLC
jgi:hypothetical protein